MPFQIEYKTGAMEMDRFREKYQDREKFMAFCRECPRYDALWSCPPLSFDADAFLQPYTWASLLCAQIILDEETILAADTPEKIKDVGWTILSGVKLDLESKLRALEAKLPGSVSLSSGGCNLCDSCTRKSGLPCRQPDKMRYSLDAFGFDLTAITKDMFQLDIIWCRDRLPKYFTLIHGLIGSEPAGEALWKSAGLSAKSDPVSHT